MKKTLLRSMLMACAIGLAASAFASPPSTASPPGFDQAQVSAVAKDLNPVSIVTADSGSGAQSALKAYEAKRHATPQTSVRAVATEGVGLGVRLAVGGGSSDIEHGGGSGGLRYAFALHELGEIPIHEAGWQT